MAGARGRGNKTVSSSRSSNAAVPSSSGDPPVTPGPTKTTRSTRSSTARTSSNSKALKRPAPEDAQPAPKPSKNQKKNVDFVDNTPFVQNYSAFNTPAVYSPSPRLVGYPVPTAQHYVHTTRAPAQSFPPPQMLPPTQSSSQWTYPSSWTPTSHILPQPAIQPTRPLPPPYRLPQHGNSSATIIDADDFSDGEDGEVEVVEGYDGEADESASIQFLPARNVLHDHWEKRSIPVPTRQLVPHPPGRGRRADPQEPRPAATYHVPSPTRLAPAPATLTPNRQNPIPAVPPLIIPTEPGQIVAPAIAPASPRVPSTLPAFQPNSPPTTQGWYPPVWQRLIEHIGTHLLHDMLFTHPFPAGSDGQSWAREAASAAFISYNNKEDVLLDKASYDDYKQSIVNLALKAARSHRGKFRDDIIDMILESNEIRINDMSPTVIVSRVESLLTGNRYLDSPYPALVKRPVDVMYKSPILKSAIEKLYMTQPWRDAIVLPWFKDDSLELSPVFDPDEGYAARPPISFVAFAAAAYDNALACFATGVRDTVHFNEVNYRTTYDQLYDLIEADCTSPVHGETARLNIQSLMSRVLISNAGLRYGLLP